MFVQCDTSKTIDYGREEGMMKDLFDNDNKGELFDRIAKLFYEKNFGTAQKSEIELVMFSILYDSLRKKSKEVMVKSYDISRILGITQQRAESLIEKCKLKFGTSSNEWKTVFGEACKKAVRKDDSISVVIPDRYVYSEIQHLVEENYGIVEIPLNPHVMTISYPDFMMLVYCLVDEKDRVIIESAIQEEDPTIKLGEDHKKNVKRWFLNAGTQVIQTIIQSAVQAGVSLLFSNLTGQL